MGKIQVNLKTLDSNANKAKTSITQLGKDKLSHSNLDYTDLDSVKKSLAIVSKAESLVKKYVNLANNDVEQYKKAGQELVKADKEDAKKYAK